MDELSAEGNVCARCAERSGTCCSLEPGQEEFCFPLSELERGRMEAAGAKAEHFARQANTEAFVDNLRRLFPGEDAAMTALFPPDGEHERLAVHPDGRCRLLGPAGCLLKREARPLYCLLFPFWMLGGERLYFQHAQCQALRESPGGAGLLAKLGASGREVRRLYSELRRSWGLPERS